MKDVEHAFGVLQARFAIVREPTRFFYPETLQDIMKACVILHNMIIKYEQDENKVVEFDYEQIDENPPIQVSREQTNEFTVFIESHQCIQDHEMQGKHMLVSHTKHRQQKINGSTSFAIGNMYYVNFNI